MGLIGAVALSRLIFGLLFEVSAYDPGVFAGLAEILVLVAVIAAVIPARRATREEPTEALRSE